MLDAALRSHGLEPRIHDVATRPTASLIRRAARLLEEIERSAWTDDLPIHIVGHSTGGLDARLLLSPGSRIASEAQHAALRRRVRSVVTVATPHFGTPVATFFSTMYGQQLLRLLSLATMASIRRGALPVSVIGGLATLLVHPIGLGAAPAGITEQLYRELLADFAPDRQQAIERSFEDVAEDAALLVQLRPEGAELVNALAPVPESVACGSVVVAARPPMLGSVLQAGANTGNQASHFLYSRLHRLASELPGTVPRTLNAAHRRALAGGPEFMLLPGANDGMVPTRSQTWGEVIAAAGADHLDVIGHFAGPRDHPPHHDWLFTGSGFDLAAFRDVWMRVAAFIARSHEGA